MIDDDKKADTCVSVYCEIRDFLFRRMEIMKALLLSDFYIFRKNFTLAFIIMIVLLGLSLVTGLMGNEDFTDGFFTGFLTIYPCLIAGMMPLSLYSYDERSKWDKYCLTMPLTRKRYVCGKYLFGLLLTLLLAALILIVVIITGERYALFVFSLNILCGCLVPALTLPFAFRFGSKVGVFIFGLLCGSSGILYGAMTAALESESGNLFIDITGIPYLPAAAGAAAVLYVASMFVSVRIYQSKDMN